MQDEIVKSLDVFWEQAKVGSYEKFQIGHWKKLALELNLGFAQLMRRLRGLCGEIQKVSGDDMALPDDCRPVLELVKIRAGKIASSLS